MFPNMPYYNPIRAPIVYPNPSNAPSVPPMYGTQPINPSGNPWNVLWNIGTGMTEASASGGGYYGGSHHGSGRSAPAPVKWKTTYKSPNAPSWWQGLTPNRVDANSAYLSLVNAFIPYMSPEDQLSTAQYLSTAFPKEFGKPYQVVSAKETNNIPTGMTTNTRDYFTSTERAEQAKKTLQTMIKSIADRTGKDVGKVQKSLGPGYNYLTSVINTLGKFGGDTKNKQTRAEYLQMLGQLDPLLAMGGGEQFGAFKPIAQKLAQPFFSAGQITPTSKFGSTTRFGTPNKSWY